MGARAALASPALLVALAGCQAIIGLEEGTLREGEGQGGATASSTTSSGSGGSGGSGGKQPPECGSVDDKNECTDDACDDGAPVHTPIAAGAACTQGGAVCDGEGHCVECNAGSDCQSQVCAMHHCQAPTCDDKVKNQDERDTDCGGATCPKCSEGKACAGNVDCVGLSCVAGVCGPDATVLLVAGGSEGGLVGELHPGSTWITTPIAEATSFEPALATTQLGNGVGLIRSEPDGELHYAIWSGGAWAPFTPLLAGLKIQGGPSISALGPVVHAAHRGSKDGDDNHYHAVYDGAAWSLVGEVVGAVNKPSHGPSAPAIAARSGGALTVGFIGDAQGGDVLTQDRNGGGWGQDKAVGSGAAPLVHPSVVATSGGTTLLLLYVKAADGQVVAAKRTGGAWSSPTPILGALTDDPVALAALDGDAAIAALRGKDGKLYYALYDGSAWSSATLFAPPGQLVASSPALARGASGAKAELVFAGPTGDLEDNALYHSRFDAASNPGGWSTPVLIGSGKGLVHAAIAVLP